MEHLRYFVVVNDPADKEQICNELKSQDGTDHIPDRSVSPDDEMLWSEYNSIFLLTEQEAETLKTDPRVRDVHRDPADLGIRPKIRGYRTGNFERAAAAPQADSKNWGLIRSINATNSYGISSTTDKWYTYNLDGTGVDVIIMDTGVDPYHPEFAVNADGSGGTRVVNHDWTQYGIITSIPTGGFLGDCDGHGSNVASIIAGNTNGWAAGAKIYSLRIVPGTGGTEYDMTDGRILGLVSEFQAWGTIRAFHNAKPVDPTTGYKRPTIVNCSYGYFTNYTPVLSSITHRGVTYTTNTTSGLYGTIGVNVEANYGGSHGQRYSAYDAEVASTVNIGVIVVGSAGNDTHKIDVSGGLDYNNYWTSSGGFNYYYHRGATPVAADGVICVGCIGAVTNGSGVEHKRQFSSTGPRVDIWAPGDQIMGAYSNNYYTGAPVYDSRSTVSTSSGASYYMQKISGTSQAAPQVAGVLTLLAQLRPNITPTTAKSWLLATAASWDVDTAYYGGTSGTYTNFASLQGSASKSLYMPYNSSATMLVSTP